MRPKYTKTSQAELIKKLLGDDIAGVTVTEEDEEYLGKVMDEMSDLDYDEEEDVEFSDEDERGYVTHSPTRATPRRYTPSHSELEVFAKAAMRELSNNNIDTFVLLKNDKLRDWWAGVLQDEMAAQIKREAAERKKMLKEQALAKLSDEEKVALGLTRKVK